MKERAKFFGLDKSDDFAEFERKYLKAASEEGKTASNPVRQTDEKAAPTAKTTTANTAEPVVNSGESGIIKLPDIPVFRSLGAKATNYEIMDLVTGDMYRLVEGTKLTNVEVFAGKGVRSKYVRAYIYAERYGGNLEDWQHVKGVGFVDTDDGERKAELHWSQCEGIGKFDFFIKRWLDE